MGFITSSLSLNLGVRLGIIDDVAKWISYGTSMFLIKSILGNPGNPGVTHYVLTSFIDE